MEPHQVSELLEARGNTILAFGPQIGTFNKAFVDSVRSGIRNGPSFFTQAAADLPTYWDALVTKVPQIEQNLHGRELVEELNSVLKNGLHEERRQTYNTVSAPIAYIAQIVQHWQYLYMSNEGQDESADPQASWIARHKDYETASLGFCGGLMAAFVVASSHNMQSLVSV